MKVAKKDRKETFVESMMVESEEKGYIKRKYAQIQQKKHDAGRHRKSRSEAQHRNKKLKSL